MTQKQRALKYPNAGKVHVVLTADVPGQGQKGDLLWTTRGFLLNKLLPQGLAKNATPAMVKQVRRAVSASSVSFVRLSHLVCPFRPSPSCAVDRPHPARTHRDHPRRPPSACADARSPGRPAGVCRRGGD